MKTKSLELGIMCLGCLCLVACSGCGSCFGPYYMDDPVYKDKMHMSKMTGRDPGADNTPNMQLAYNGRVGSRHLDSVDRSKLSHALDNPLGKTTTWMNETTRTTYSVTPLTKVTIDGNPYCRTYKMTTTRGSRTRESQGTACVDANSNWENVSG